MNFCILLFLIISISFKESHQDQLDDILSIIATGTVDIVGSCVNIPNIEVQFWLYSEEISKTVLDPNNPSQVDTTKPIVIVIHGWSSSADTYYIQDIKNAYIENIDEIQVILVDWSPLSSQGYFTAYCNLPQIAQTVATFICNLHTDLNLDLSELHVVGHSMGAHISGIAGQNVKASSCGTIRRITGLDPAGPLYQGIPTNQRLSPDDSTLVDVIHTNAGILGYYTSLGDVDFYVNCGTIQPGCDNADVSGATDIGDIEDIPLVAAIICDHIISCTYFAETIRHTEFIGTSCTFCPVICLNDFIRPQTLLMGEYMPTTFNKKIYAVSANLELPVPTTISINSVN